MWSWFRFFFNIIVIVVMISTAISIELTPLPWFASFWFCNIKYCWTRHYSWCCCIHRSRHVMACSNHATNIHAPLHWLNNRLSRVCAGAPYLSPNTSSHRSTSGNVFLRSQCKWKIDVAFACTRNFPLNAMRFSQIRMAEEPEREGVGGKCYGYVCLDLYFISVVPSFSSSPLISNGFSFSFSFMFASLWWLRTKRNEFSLWPTKRELCDYLLRKLMQCAMRSRVCAGDILRLTCFL